jgi:hypothetical protein
MINELLSKAHVCLQQEKQNSKENIAIGGSPNAAGIKQHETLLFITGDNLLL